MASRCFLALAGLLLIVASAWGGQNVVVVLDDSGSMDIPMRSDRRTKKMDAAKRALIDVLQQLSEDTQVGVLALNARTPNQSWIVPLGPIDRVQAGQAINALQPSGQTPLGRCMKIGTDALLTLRDREHYGEYRLLIVTDGEATDARMVETFLPDILSRGITVDVIGVDMQEDHSLAIKVHTYRRADDPASLTRAIQEVFAETSDLRDEMGQSDFELLAGISGEMAAAALAALTASGNHPIGERPPTAAAGDGRAAPAAAAPARNRRTTGVGMGAISVFVAGILCFVAFIALVVVTGIVVFVARRSA